MSYTLFAIIVYLLEGAPSFPFSFNPIIMGFVIALICDLFFNRNLFIKPTV